MIVAGCPIAVDLVKRWYAHAAPPDTISTRSPAQLRSCGGKSCRRSFTSRISASRGTHAVV
eukprot:30850-Pyramimonas_sp.AAC.1